MAKLDKARAQWRGSAEEDRPCFTRWMAVMFGMLLTEFRETARVITGRENLIEEVELEMMWQSRMALK